MCKIPFGPFGNSGKPGKGMSPMIVDDLPVKKRGFRAPKVRLQEGQAILLVESPWPLVSTLG